MIQRHQHAPCDSRRQLLIRLASSLALCSLAACRSVSVPPPPSALTATSTENTVATAPSHRHTRSTAAAASGAVPLTFARWQVSPGIMKQLVYNPVARFEHTHPGIHVSVVTAPAGPPYLEKVLTLIAGGVPPDVVGLPGPEAVLPVLASKGILADLGPLIARDAKVVQPQDFYPQALQVGQWQGKQYGLPSSTISTAVLVYNADALKKAGITQTPAQLYDAGTWTWNDFTQVARQATIRKPGVTLPSQYGFLVPFDVQMGSSFIWEAGGHILNTQRTKCLLDTPQSIRGLQFLYDLQHEAQVSPTPSFLSTESSLNLFTSGRLCMVLNWAHTTVIQYASLPFSWDISPLPIGPAGEIVNGNFNNIGLTQHAKLRDIGWSFIEYLTSGPVYLEKQRFALPPRRSVYQAWLTWAQGLHHPKNIQYLQLLRRHSRELPYSPVWSHIEVAWPQEVSYLEEGTRTPTTVARSLTTAIDAILQRGAS